MSHTENFHTREAETDKTTTPHPSSHHIRRVQQLRHMNMGAMGGVVMQSSSPSLASAMTLSPALSARSVSTLVSQSSTMTDMTAVSGSSHASDYMTSTSPYRYNISSPFEAQSPGASTLYNPTSERHPQRPRGVYTFFQSFLGPVSTDTLSNNSSRSMYETPQRHSTLKESSFRKRRRYYGKNSSTRSTPLSSSLYYISGLSDRQTRKRARGIDGKAFFSNERTYMHWIKFGLLLGSMALTLLSFGQSVGLNVGLFLVLITMSTLIYATAVFHTRHRWMIQLRQDVRYYDRLGPSLLFVALFLAYATNVILTMNKITDDYDDDEGFNFYNSRHLDA
ncbi:hypothetical protein BGZ99_004160 [Dissophora globulifera]|uniref:DUF202 domain-containing protein n=1 Tax=Dissophora globulifera TaxID=979702 RepID=A0A9P6RIP2_9FUNG|nr:hypothetical protein BGZ99_004160 [Dissophora globulifera]